jgi:hypothetical protein
LFCQTVIFAGIQDDGRFIKRIRYPFSTAQKFSDNTQQFNLNQKLKKQASFDPPMISVPGIHPCSICISCPSP